MLVCLKTASICFPSALHSASPQCSLEGSHKHPCHPAPRGAKQASDSPRHETLAWSAKINAPRARTAACVHNRAVQNSSPSWRGAARPAWPWCGVGPATAAPQALTSSHPSALASAPSLLLARVFCNSLSRVFLEHTFQRSSGTGLTLPLSATPSPQQDHPAPPRSQRWDGGRGPSSALARSKISDLRVRTRSKELHRKQNIALKIARRRIRAFIQPRLQVLHGLFCILCKNNRHQQRDEQTKPSWAPPPALTDMCNQKYPAGGKNMLSLKPTENLHSKYTT